MNSAVSHGVSSRYWNVEVKFNAFNFKIKRFFTEDWRPWDI